MSVIPATSSTSRDLPTQVTPRVSVASWLVVLFVMLFSLNTIGGWVRLSGAGVAIPQWPIINGSLLPPLTDQGWGQVKAAYDTDQARLMERARRGELSRGNLGRAPRDLGEFKGMFLTEWAHRLFSALVGVMAAGCLTIVLRRAELRRLIGVPMGIAGALIVFQAAIGGLLVEEGTGTHWLFLHQGNAAAIMACVLVSMLRLLAVDQSVPLAADVHRRRALRRCASVAVALGWLQLVAGALVAGSRASEPMVITGAWKLSPFLLWESPKPLAWNLLDNAPLHQWLHHWLALALVASLLALYVIAWRAAPLPSRLRLALKVSATFVAVQVLLGVGNVASGVTPWSSLAHQAMGMCLLMSLVLTWFDARHEPTTDAATATRPLTTVTSGVDA